MERIPVFRIPVLLMAACMCFASSPLPAQTRVALVIGNARYEAQVGSLKNSVNDAKAMSKALRSLGFKVIEKHNATRDEMLSAVRSFRGMLKGAEVSLFYFAGHGLCHAGSNYLVPIRSGYAPQAGDATALRMLAESKLFNAEQVVAEMGTAGGGSCNIVILDACRNTPVARDPTTRDFKDGGLVEMKPPAGSLIAFATDAGHTASDGEERNGLYTGELIAHLTTPGITIEQVFKRTRASVMEKSGGRQVPAEYSRLLGEDVYLARSRTPSETPVPKASPIEPPSSAAILHLATTGQVDATIEALQLKVAAKGPGDEAAAPLSALLDGAKEQLKSANTPSHQVEAAMKTCRLVLSALPSCLPASHARHEELAAKANNRLGDCLMIQGKASQALACYQTAVRLAPRDAYPLYNRGRAQLAIGNRDAAISDFTQAASKEFTQSGARKLAQAALEELR